MARNYGHAYQWGRIHALRNVKGKGFGLTITKGERDAYYAGYKAGKIERLERLLNRG